MTERKPGGVSFETWVDAQIREAQERGEFDDLPGKGKPLRGLDGTHDDMWWIKDWLRRENVHFTPPGLALRKAVEDALDGLGRLTSEVVVREMVAQLNARILELNRKPSEGPPSNLMPLDVDRVVRAWMDARQTLRADG